MSVNAVTPTGITIQTFADVANEILNGAGGYAGLLQTYGPGLNIDPNSADGNMVNIYAQGKTDTLEQILSVGTSFDPGQARGVLLDQRCAINGIFRKPGTYTSQDIVVVVSQAVTLPGLDLFPTAPYTVADGNGNQYQLIETYSFPTAGSQTLTFQAASLGPVTSATNTITVPVTVLTGVVSVNNPNLPNSVGQAEESDSALRIRRANSTSLPSKGWFQGMYAGILAVDGVTSALVLENQTNTTNSLGMPPHSIWLIVAGDPDEQTLGEAIYAKRNACVDWTNGGTGGAGTAVLTGTTVASAVVVDGGSGYTGTPTVSITGGGGTGATATATVVSNKVTAINITGAGSGYTGLPTIGFSGGGGSGAVATAVLTGTTVASISVDSGGVAYDNIPSVLLTGGGGTGATATAAITAGAISSFAVTAAGTGYTAPPTVVINPDTVEVPITQKDGSIFDIFYDTPVEQPLWFEATLTAITGSLDKAFIQQQILAEFGPGGPQAYNIGQSAATAAIIAYINLIASNASVASEGVSNDGSMYSPLVTTTNVNYQFQMTTVTIS